MEKGKKIPLYHLLVHGMETWIAYEQTLIEASGSKARRAKFNARYRLHFRRQTVTYCFIKILMEGISKVKGKMEKLLV